MILPWRDVPLGDGTISTSITPAEAQTLHDLAQGRTVLEIGSAYGYSAIRMAQMAYSVLAVDPHTGHDSLDAMRANLARFDPRGRVSVWQETSQRALPILRAAGATFGLVFIDGDHSREAVEHDVARALELLAPNGVLCCHDYGEDSCPGVAEALDGLGLVPTKVVDTLWIG